MNTWKYFFQLQIIVEFHLCMSACPLHLISYLNTKMKYHYFNLCWQFKIPFHMTINIFKKIRKLFHRSNVYSFVLKVVAKSCHCSCSFSLVHDSAAAGMPQTCRQTKLTLNALPETSKLRWHVTKLIAG